MSENGDIEFVPEASLRAENKRITGMWVAAEGDAAEARNELADLWQCIDDLSVEMSYGIGDMLRAMLDERRSDDPTHPHGDACEDPDCDAEELG